MSIRNSFPVILMFLKGSNLTIEEEQEVMTLGPNVRLRNSQKIVDGDCIEKCDGVAGKVPKSYKHFPTAQQALKSFKDAANKRLAEKQKLLEERRTRDEAIAKKQRDHQLALEARVQEHLVDKIAESKLAESKIAETKLDTSSVTAAAGSGSKTWTPNAAT